jgi:hypothetical protein
MIDPFQTAGIYLIMQYKSLSRCLNAKSIHIIGLGVRIMVFNATFNNISVILWQSVLLVKETEVPGENH